MEKLAGRVGADLVILALPPEITHEVAADFIRVSPCLVIEKPAALTTTRIRELVRIEETSKNSVIVGYNRRGYPLVSRIREVLSVDPPSHVDVVVVEDMSHVHSTKSQALRASYLRHSSSTHFLDLVQFLFGPISMREISVSRSRIEPGFLDYSIRAVGRSGVSINVTIDAGDRRRRGFSISTVSGRRVQLAPLEHLSIIQGDLMGSSDISEPEESCDCLTSYSDSFVIQLRKIVNSDLGTLHRLDDSLKLSQIVDELEVASSQIRDE